MKKRIENKYASLNPTQNGCVAYAAYADAIEKIGHERSTILPEKDCPLRRD